MRQLLFALACAALYAAVLALYWPSLRFAPSSLDDRGQLQLAAQQSFADVFTPDRYGHVRPVKSALFRLAARGPLSWAIVRASMLAAVLLATFLVQRLATRLTGSRWEGIATAACWALNPTTATVACWLSGAHVALCLIAMLLYLACARRALAPATVRSLAFAALAWLALLFALASYELALIAPLLAWRQQALVVTRADRSAGDRRRAERQLYLGSAAVALLYAAYTLGLGRLQADYRFAAEPGWLRTWSAARYAGENASFWWLPAGRFGVLLGDRPAQQLLASGVAWAVAVAAGALLWKQRARDAVLTFGLVWCALSLAPVVNLVPLGNTPRALHYAVVPGVGFALVLVRAAVALARRVAPLHSRAAWALPCALLAALGVYWLPESVRAVHAWGDDERLFATSAANHPREVEPLVNLASVQLDRGRYDRAAATLERASALAPGDRAVVRNQFALLWQTDRIDAALALLDRHPALAQRPEFQLGRAQALLRLRRDREALAPLQQAFDSRSPEIDAEQRLTAGSQLVLLLAAQGQVAEAHRIVMTLASEYPGRREVAALAGWLRPR